MNICWTIFFLVALSSNCFVDGENSNSGKSRLISILKQELKPNKKDIFENVIKAKRAVPVHPCTKFDALSMGSLPKGATDEMDCVPLDDSSHDSVLKSMDALAPSQELNSQQREEEEGTVNGEETVSQNETASKNVSQNESRENKSKELLLENENLNKNESEFKLKTVNPESKQFTEITVKLQNEEIKTSLKEIGNVAITSTLSTIGSSTVKVEKNYDQEEEEEFFERGYFNQIYSTDDVNDDQETNSPTLAIKNDEKVSTIIEKITPTRATTEIIKENVQVFRKTSKLEKLTTNEFGSPSSSSCIDLKIIKGTKAYDAFRKHLSDGNTDRPIAFYPKIGSVKTENVNEVFKKSNMHFSSIVAAWAAGFFGTFMLMAILASYVKSTQNNKSKKRKKKYNRLEPCDESYLESIELTKV